MKAFNEIGTVRSASNLEITWEIVEEGETSGSGVLNRYGKAIMFYETVTLVHISAYNIETFLGNDAPINGLSLYGRYIEWTLPGFEVREICALISY